VREGHREPDPLLLATGELVRVTLEEGAVTGERALPHHPRDTLGNGAVPVTSVRLDYLPELEADPQRRVQRRGRVLRDIGDERAPQTPELLLIEREDVVVTEQHRPARDPQAAPGVAEQRQPDCGLAGPGLAHHPENLTSCDPERHLADDRCAGGFDLDLQVTDGDRGHGGFGRLPGQLGRAHSSPRARSMPAAVRAMPSPIRPVPSVSSAMAMIGATAPQGWTTSTNWFCLIMVPQFAPLTLGESPRYASPAIKPME